MSFPTAEPAPPRKSISATKITLLAVAAVVVLAAGAAAWLLVGRSNGTTSAAAPAAPIVAGVERPDPTCVTTNGKDHDDMWNANGWWAGRVDGDVKQMNAFQALSLKLGGHDISSVWICAPRSQG